MLVSVVQDFTKKSQQCFVVFVSSDSNKKLVSHNKDKEISEWVNKYHKSEEFSGGLGESLMLRGRAHGNFENVMLVGLGDKKDIQGEQVRRAVAFAYRALRKEKQKNAAICLESLSGYSVKGAEVAYLVAEAVELTNYKFTEFLTKKDHHEVKIEIRAKGAKDKTAYSKAVQEAFSVSSGVNFARKVSDFPSNIMTPDRLAKETQKEAKGSKLKVSIWDKAKIKKEKLGSLMGVAQGSAQDPRVIIMEYQGAAKTKKPVALVGKGLTFDTGGISIKPSSGMEAMKYDMCGGANVIGTMLAIARLGLKVNVIAFVGAVENMPDGNAIKPGDILTARNGKTIEVTNTDAEGRLVLADLLVLASERKPQSILNIATLTGAIIVALGHLHTGIFTQSDKLHEKIQDAASRAGEDVWRMPLLEAHAKQMKSPYADLCNMGTPERAAGSAQAAGFLSRFVGEGIDFMHFDIASQMSDMGSVYPYHPDRGACGAMIRTFLEYVKKA